MDLVKEGAPVGSTTKGLSLRTDHFGTALNTLAATIDGVNSATEEQIESQRMQSASLQLTATVLAGGAVSTTDWESDTCPRLGSSVQFHVQIKDGSILSQQNVKSSQIGLGACLADFVAGPFRDTSGGVNENTVKFFRVATTAMNLDTAFPIGGAHFGEARTYDQIAGHGITWSTMGVFKWHRSAGDQTSFYNPVQAFVLGEGLMTAFGLNFMPLNGKKGYNNYVSRSIETPAVGHQLYSARCGQAIDANHAAGGVCGVRFANFTLPPGRSTTCPAHGVAWIITNDEDVTHSYSCLTMFFSPNTKYTGTAGFTVQPAGVRFDMWSAILEDSDSMMFPGISSLPKATALNMGPQEARKRSSPISSFFRKFGNFTRGAQKILAGIDGDWYGRAVDLITPFVPEELALPFTLLNSRGAFQKDGVLQGLTLASDFADGLATGEVSVMSVAVDVAKAVSESTALNTMWNLWTSNALLEMSAGEIIETGLSLAAMAL
jgi:hypothetical protein